MKHRITVIALLLGSLGAAAGCADDSADASPGGTTGSASDEVEALPSDRVVIDVRTPEEYEERHVDDALLLDVSAPDFDARVAELDPDGRYLVYCRSGNRSAQAAERMRAAGLDVEDGGGLEEMDAAGWTFTAG